MNEIKIYIADLNAYNDGRLVGQWVELPIDKDELQAVVNKLTNDGRTDYAIHDYEAPFKISEYDDPFKLNEVAEKVEALDETQRMAVFSAYKDLTNDIDEAISYAEDAMYYHDCDNMSDVAYQWHQEAGTDMDAPFMNYVDWERVGRDMEIEGTFYKLENNVWVQFHN